MFKCRLVVNACITPTYYFCWSCNGCLKKHFKINDTSGLALSENTLSQYCIENQEQSYWHQAGNAI